MPMNRKRNRLKNYDYSTDGGYYVTVCTKDREHCFGEIRNNVMCLNEYGCIVRKQWLWLEEQYDYVYLDEFIIMPNHLHGILVIDNINSNIDGRDKSRPCRDKSRLVPTGNDFNNAHIKIKSLSELIGAFKTTSSKLIHQCGLDEFAWQRSPDNMKKVVSV